MGGIADITVIVMLQAPAVAAKCCQSMRKPGSTTHAISEDFPGAIDALAGRISQSPLPVHTAGLTFGAWPIGTARYGSDALNFAWWPFAAGTNAVTKPRLCAS
jgi:hypothetical protein